ncbi:hypothetical protein NV379_02720 [Paenibacillus sp. N1-5-1-14]|uniref:PAAR domain-containing protein n=1 Tax=Paenibacillus radicibacter TaxID=2972488 RepID=UPI0021597F38|nr:PAAR domain-containing protein [Paenibacillus radicibacter]MCR8641560.1 hypothetical protein [Paenibacillus radicibacter]
MAGAAYDGLPIAQSTSYGYISYTYKVWNPYNNPYDCGTDEHPRTCYRGGYDEYQDNSNAIVNGTVKSSTSNVYINGRGAVTIGDSTIESWTNSGFTPIFVSASPGQNGSGNGSVTGGSSNVFVNGRQLATNGSSTSTCVNTTSTINGGSSNVFVN